MLQVGDTSTTLLAPKSFQGKITEQQLETYVVANPQLTGEDLLVLGRQLHEFEEDLDRLDVLAVDADGEIVLVELKVSGDFRVTDLQALAYAGAYAPLSREHFAGTLQRTLLKTNPQARLDEAKAKIVEFLQLDSFEEWEPSQHVRIKLIAPDFPRRVLNTVKWLVGLYGMKLEAVQVRLFGSADGSYHLTFERLLPLPGEEDFDLTVRFREDRKRGENVSRRPSIVPVLIRNKILSNGQKLWLDESVLPPDSRALYDPDKIVFQAEVVADAGAVKFRWRADEAEEPQLLAPSVVPNQVYAALIPDFARDERPWKPVHSSFTLEPGGKTLGEIASEKGIW